MKGLVLAGGSGKRLRPLTYSGPKQLLPVANRPVLFHAFEKLAAANIRDVGVIIAPETGAEVRDVAGTGERFGLRLTYIVQDHPGGIAHAVVAARDFLGDTPFCLFLGDNLLGAPLTPFAATFKADARAAALLLLKEVDNPGAFGVAELGPDGHVARLVEKPAAANGRLAIAGIYFFRPEVHAAIDRIRPSARGELEITDAITELLVAGRIVRCEKLASFWLDTGDKSGLIRANEMALDAWTQRDVRGAVDDESLVIGRVDVAESALILRSTVRGPVIIGEGAHLEDAYVGPSSSIGPGATVLRSRIERSLLLEGSKVQDIPRLRDSIVGRRACVQARGREGREENRPSGIHDTSPDSHGSASSVFVGDDSTVELTVPEP